MSARARYDAARAHEKARDPIACGLCRAGLHERCTGLGFNRTDEPCPCKEAGHGEAS